MRRNILKYLRKISKINPGEVSPTWLRLIYMILFPIENLYLRNKFLNYDPQFDVFILFGMKYSADLFKNWAHGGIPIGKKFIITKRFKDTFSISEVKK